MVDIPDPINSEESSHENQERTERLSQALNKMYHLGPEASVVEASDNRVILHSSDVDGQVGVDYRNPDQPCAFFIPDGGPAVDNNPLSTEETMELMAKINSEIMAIRDTLKFHRAGVFSYLQEKLGTEELVFSHAFQSTARKAGFETVEVFRIIYKGHPMIIRIPFGIGLPPIPHDPVAETVEGSRLAKEINNKYDMEGMFVSVPYAYGALQMAPQYEGSGNKDAQIGRAAAKAVGMKGFMKISDYLKNGFDVTTVGERFGNVVIDVVFPNESADLYSTESKLKEALSASE